MATITRTIKTDTNTWTFDVSMPKKGKAKILRTHGDITNKNAVEKAISILLTQLVEENKILPDGTVL